MAQLLYPVGIQSFSSIRERGFSYVDKTKYILELISTGKYFFLSRPRRFGKSLLISTIEEIFLGHKELFDGLYISRANYDWKTHPVLHLDFTGKNYNSQESLLSHLNRTLEKWEATYGNELANRSLEERFDYVITKAVEKTGRKVVILIDEYDKPLLETVDQPELQEMFRNQLRAFYGNLKSQDKNIHFAMLTGVTKFGHLSIFSDLNNLQDISMVEEFAGICGITEEELHHYFEPGVAALGRKRGLSTEEAYEQLRINYDGYNFCPLGGPDIYNPFSVLSCLKAGWIRDFWFQTGTPTFLVKLIKSRQIDLKRLGDVQVPLQAVENLSFDLRSSLMPVLYQSGYLTIKDYDPITDLLSLTFPNREVERGFLLSLMNMYLPSENDSAFSIAKFYEDIRDGRAEEFMVRLQSLFADFNHDGFNKINLEQHYQNVTFLVFKLLGFLTSVEYKTASGRIDMVVKTDNYIFVFEFKLDSSPEAAIRQIDEKGYLLPFNADSRRLIKIGVSFSKNTRTIDNWIIEKV